MISMTDIDKFKRLWSQCHLDQYQLYNVKQKEVVDLLINEYHKKDYFACYQAVYMATQPIEFTIPDHVSIRLLTQDYLDDVYHIYHHMSDRDYIKDRIEKKALWGLFHDGQLGWIYWYASRRKHGHFRNQKRISKTRLWFFVGKLFDE